IWAYFGPHDEVTKSILFVLSLFIIGQMIIELINAKLQLEEKYPMLALWQLLPNLSRLVFIASLVYLFSISLEVTQIAFIYAGVAVIFIAIGIYQLYQMSQNKLDLKGHGEKKIVEITTPGIKETFSHSWAFGLAGVFAFIYLQSDIIMVKYMAGNSEAGYYNASFVIITSILIFPSVLYSKFLMPKYHRWANYEKEKFYEVYKKGNIVMFISGTVIMLCVLVLSDFFIPLIFGNEYESSISLLKILSLTLPVYFVAYSVGATLVTNEHMKLKVKLMGSVALVNIVLNFVLISVYGASGAAVATVASNLLLLLLYYKAAHDKVFSIKGNENVAIN
ncbi:MAG: oligosaccharide flippase family protein, partial [Epsilonproteobacteria bacterium]|nr:oligosaccharide flippase family protein [Campylobacterota bacterium]